MADRGRQPGPGRVAIIDVSREDGRCHGPEAQSQEGWHYDSSGSGMEWNSAIFQSPPSRRSTHVVGAEA